MSGFLRREIFKFLPQHEMTTEDYYPSCDNITSWRRTIVLFINRSISRNPSYHWIFATRWQRSGADLATVVAFRRQIVR